MIDASHRHRFYPQAGARVSPHGILARPHGDKVTMTTFEIRSICKVAALIVGQLSRGLIIALVLSRTVSAQAMTVTLAGTVTDEAGAMVADAQLTLSSASTGLQRHARTGREGDFQIPPLESGG